MSKPSERWAIPEAREAWAVVGGRLGPLRSGDFISLSVVGGQESCHIARRPGFFRRLLRRPWEWKPATTEEAEEIKKILYVRNGPILDDFKRGDGDPRDCWWPA